MIQTIKNIDEINSLENNQIIGNPELINSSINFKGFNNVLYCETGVKIQNSNITFNGNNSIIYLSFSDINYVAHIFVFHNSTVYIGKDNNFSATLKINVQEAQNLIIGDECIFGPDVTIRTSDAFPLFDGNSKSRINMPKSVFIGDHVWLGHLVYISKGVKIGSGAIVYNNSMVLPSNVLSSNAFYAGNPAFKLDENVFFTDFYTAYFNEEKSLQRSSYTSDVYLYEVVPETLSLDYVNQILDSYNVDERLQFIKELFVNNKRKNRFAIK